MSIPAGWPVMPSWFQDWKVGSQSMVKVVPVDCTKLLASPRLSWVPTPITVSLSALSRANCSTPGASRRQMGQWGAQNHSTMARSEGAKLARFTSAPVATLTKSTEGSSDAGTGQSGWGWTPVSGWGWTPVSGWGWTPVSGWGWTPVSGWGWTPVSGWGWTPVSGWGWTPVLRPKWTLRLKWGLVPELWPTRWGRWLRLPLWVQR